MLEGAHDAATPEGEEAAVRATAPLKPPVDVREIVEVAVSPATNDTAFGVAVIVKSGLAGVVTVTEIDVVWTRDSFVPVAVMMYDPGVELANVHVDVRLPLIFEGSHDVVTPAGTDNAVRATVPLKPPVAWSEIVEFADRPASNETVPGFAESVKSGPPALKNSNGEGAVTSPCRRLPPPQTSSISFSREEWVYEAVDL